MKTKWIVLGIVAAVIVPSIVGMLNSERNPMVSAASEKEISISGSVNDEDWDFYPLDYLHKGSAVIVEMDSVGGKAWLINQYVYIGVVDRRAHDPDPEWVKIYEGNKEQFVIPKSSEYMLQIRGWKQQFEDGVPSKGTVTIVD